MLVFRWVILLLLLVAGVSFAFACEGVKTADSPTAATPIWRSTGGATMLLMRPPPAR